jgi:hypothetical protein
VSACKGPKQPKQREKHSFFQALLVWWFLFEKRRKLNVTMMIRRPMILVALSETIQNLNI